MAATLVEINSYRTQDKVYQLLRDRPELREYLEHMVEWETAHPQSDRHPGWLWQEVNCATGTINALIVQGIVQYLEEYSSRSRSYYRLTSVADTRAGLANLDIAAVQTGPIDVDSLFSLVFGLEQEKSLLRNALRADKPVHCLLQSPPGMAKTLILGDIGNLPGAEFYVGSTTSKSGLVGMLLTQRPVYLVIDELDKMGLGDMSPLLNLMETGMVTRLIHGANERVSLDTKVFAGCNDVSKIDSAIISRFALVTIPAYSPTEFVNIATRVLIEREGQGPELAKLIARNVVVFSTDIRDAVRVARMARRDPLRVAEIIACLFRIGPRPVVSIQDGHLGRR